MAVEKKYEGETRHETALKYIRSAEKTDYGEVKNSFIDQKRILDSMEGIVGMHENPAEMDLN